MGIFWHDERQRRSRLADRDDRDFGRHFADDVLNEMLRGHTIQQAIDAAVTRWMGWTIGRQTSKDYGIPKGLPYLTGFVIHCEVTDEAFETMAA